LDQYNPKLGKLSLLDYMRDEDGKVLPTRLWGCEGALYRKLVDECVCTDQL